MSDKFEVWVNSQECFDTLRKCARRVSIRAKSLGILLDDAHVEAENRDDYLSALASDLWQFLKGNAAKIAQQATIHLVSGDDAAFMAFVSQRFLDYCIEERRTTSPFHIYYRRMRTNLFETGGIQYEAQARKGAFYAYSSRTDLEKWPGPIAAKDYDDKEYGDKEYSDWLNCDVTFHDVHEKSAMLSLSRHFWDESLRKLLEEYLLPIRELVRFTFAKYPLMLTIEYSDAQSEGDDDEDNVISLENHFVDYNAALSFDDAWKRQLPIIEADVVDTQLEVIAWDCVSEMTEQERFILIHIDAGEKLEAIAALLEMKGPSNVSYHQKKAYSKIHTKWSLWGPPSLKQFAEVDEGEFFIFYERVITFCKNGKTCRDSKKGAYA